MDQNYSEGSVAPTRKNPLGEKGTDILLAQQEDELRVLIDIESRIAGVADRFGGAMPAEDQALNDRERHTGRDAQGVLAAFGRQMDDRRVIMNRMMSALGRIEQLV